MAAKRTRPIGGESVRAFAPRWLAAQTHRLSPRTRELYGEIVRVHLLPALGDIPLPWLRRDQIRAFVEEALTRLGPRTVETIVACLSSMLSAAVDAGLLLHNPAHGAAHGLFPRLEPEPQALLPDEVRRLLAATRRHRDAFLVLARTGLRVGELLALEPGAIDRVARRLRITATWHTRGRWLGPPKGGRNRTVDLSREAFLTLERRAQQTRRFLFAGPSGWPYSKDALAKAFRRALVAAELPGHLTPHCLRHTFASTLLAAGAPVQYVQAQLGHASIEITVRTYGSWLTRPRHDLVDLLDDSGGLGDGVGDGVGDRVGRDGGLGLAGLQRRPWPPGGGSTRT